MSVTNETIHRDLGLPHHSHSAETITGIQADIATVLVKMIGQRDAYTAGHMSRVAWLSLKIGTKLGFDQNRLTGLGLGAELHDLGKSSIPAEILTKPGRLSPQEIELVREHPKKGYTLSIHFHGLGPSPK